MKHLPLIVAIALSSTVCASAAYWATPWFQPPARPVAAAPRAGPPPLAIEAAAGLFGGQPAGPAATTYELMGVIQDGPDGVAILAADGKPTVAVGVGQEVAPGVTVREIHQRRVLLAEGGAVRRLDLPDRGIGGLELVAAAPSAPAGAARASGRTPVTVARSGGAMPLPMVNPEIAKTPGLTPEQAQLVQQARQLEHMWEMRRPAGFGPAAFGAKPTG